MFRIFYYVQCRIRPFPHKNNHYFRKEFLYDTFLKSVRTFVVVFNTDYGSSEPLKTLVMLCYVMFRAHPTTLLLAPVYMCMCEFICMIVCMLICKCVCMCGYMLRP